MRYKIRRCGWIVLDENGIFASPEFATKEEAQDWIKERKKSRNAKN